MALDSDAELRIVLRAVGDELLKAMADMRTAVTQATDQVAGSFKHAESSVTQSMGAIRERVSVGLSGVSASIRAFGEYAAIAFGVLAGERVFANVLRSTQEWAFEVEHLAKSLGVTTEEASVYAVAAKEAGLGTEAFDRIARGLIRTVLSKGEGPFHNIGVEAKNADGSLRPLPALLTDVLNAVDGYKGGIDRLAAAQSVFGARVQPETLDGLRRWIEALPHATEVAHAFGVVVSEEGVASAREYQRATADLSLVVLGFKQIIATALRPELDALIAHVVRLGEDGTLKAWADAAAVGVHYLGETMQFLVQVVRTGIEDLLLPVRIFEGIRDAATEAARAVEHYLGVGSRGFGGAGRSWEGPPASAFGPPAPEGTKTFAGTAEAQAKAEKAAYDDLMHRQEADLKFFEHNEAAKLQVVQAYSAVIARLHGLTSAQWEAQQAKETEQKNKAAQQQRQIDDLTVEHDTKNATKRLDEDAKVVETRRKLGLLSVADAVAAETDLENRRAVIIEAGLQERLDLLKEDPNSNPVAKKQLDLQLEDAEEEHQRRLTEIMRKAQEEQVAAQKTAVKNVERLLDDVGNGFNAAIDAMVDRNRTAADVLRSLWQSLAKDVLKIIGETFAKDAVVALTGSPGKPGESTSHQLAQYLVGGAGGLFGGAGTGAASVGGAATSGADAARVASETATQGQLTAATQHGLLTRLALTAAHYAKIGALATLHFIQEQARQAFALAKWIANQAIKLAVAIATETGITAITLAESAVRHAQEAIGIVKSIISYAYKAAAGAASAVASIPYAGPILAVVNYAAMLATILPAAAQVSAEGGADLPSGGPFSATLHSKELVLPQEHAETIRGLASVVRDLVSGRSGGGSGSRITVGGPDLSLASVHASPAVARGVATLHAALTGAGESGHAAPTVVVNHYAWDVPTGRDQLRRHADFIADSVARRWAKQGTGKRHP